MTLQSFSSEEAFWDVFSNMLHVVLNENLRRHLFIFNLKNNTFQQKSVPPTSAPLAGRFAGRLLLNIGLPGSVFYFIFPLLRCSSITCDISTGSLWGFSPKLEVRRKHLPAKWNTPRGCASCWQNNPLTSVPPLCCSEKLLFRNWSL